MLITVRGETTFHEVPDPAPTGISPVPRGTAASSASQSADAGAVTLSPASHDSIPVLFSAPALPQSSAPLLLSQLRSVVTDLQAPTSLRGGGESMSSGGGGGEIARDGETLAPMSIAITNAADHGWFIVPSAANEYGESFVAGDGFEWNVAAGEFSGDWFFV